MESQTIARAGHRRDLDRGPVGGAAPCRPTACTTTWGSSGLCRWRPSILPAHHESHGAIDCRPGPSTRVRATGRRSVPDSSGHGHEGATARRGGCSSLAREVAEILPHGKRLGSWWERGPGGPEWPIRYSIGQVPIRLARSPLEFLNLTIGPEWNAEDPYRSPVN